MWARAHGQDRGQEVFLSARQKTFIDTHLLSFIKPPLTKLGHRACRWAGVARESQRPLSDGPPEPRGPGRWRLGRSSRHGVRRESELPKPAEAPFCVQPLARTEAPPFGPPKGSPEAGTSSAERWDPEVVKGQLSPAAHKVTLKGQNGARRCPHGRRKFWPHGQWCWQSHSGEGRLSGRRWTGLSDSLLSLPDHPGVRRSPTPGPWPGATSVPQLREGGVAGGAWQGHGGLSVSLPASPGEPVPREKAACRRERLSLPALGPQGCCRLLSVCQGSLEVTWAPPRLQAPGLSGGVP